MSNDIRSILERLAAVESKTTPVSVKKGLNAQQKSADQLPALFKPRSISPTLTKKPYQKHPMDGKLVGDSVEPTKLPLEEAMAEIEEDMLDKIRGDLTSYLDQLEKKVKQDTDLKDPKTKAPRDSLGKKETIDRDLVSTVKEDPTQQDTNVVPAQAGEPQPIMPESVAVKMVTLEDNTVFEIHGNERDGFEIRRGNRVLPPKFPKLDHADMALKIFQRRRQQPQDLSQDYIDER